MTAPCETVSSSTRLDKYVEFLARCRKVTNLISERAFSQLWTRHLARLRTVAWLRAVLSVGRPRIRRRFSGDGRSNPVGGNAIRENVRSYGRSLVRPMLLPAFMPVASKCSIVSCCHLWTQSPLGHWLACLVSFELADELLMLRAVGILPRGRSAAAQTETFSVASQFQCKSFRNNFDPDARIDCVHSRDSRAQAQK